MRIDVQVEGHYAGGVKITWVLCMTLAAADWPGWRGVGSLGLTTETELPVAWSAGKGVAFRTELAGTGTSSPIVVGDLVIVTSQAGSYETGDGSDPRLARDERTLAVRERAISAKGGPALELVVEAFGRRDGKRVWEYRMAATGTRPEVHEKHNLATPTPVSDGERVYAWFGNGQLVALDLKGKMIWRKDLGPFANQWGHGSSPALYKGLVVLLVDHRPAAYLLALEGKTGEVKWRVDRGKGRVSHSTPVMVAEPRGDELIVNSDQRVDAYAPGTGELLWWAGSERQTPIPSAVFADGVIYMSRGYRNSDIWAMRPGGRGEVAPLWRMPNGGSYVPSILQYQGLLYMTNEVGVVTCADVATGAVVWRERLGGIFFASPVAGDGKVYLLSETGEMYVLRAGRKAEVLAKNELGERFLASPAVSGGRIYLRGDGVLFGVGK
jgi:outer membrane protein assembly factor BamB